MMLLDQWQQAVTHIRHPEVRPRPLEPGEPRRATALFLAASCGRSSFEARAKRRGHLRMTGIGQCLRLLVLLMACTIAGGALAQPPFLPDDWKFAKRQEPNTLHYFVDARDPDFPVPPKNGP